MPYSKEALSSAVNEVNHRTLGIRAAAKKYGIPVATLHDHKSGKVQPGSKWGKATLLPIAKEKELVSYAIERANLGIGFSKQSFLRFSAKFAESEGVHFKGGIATEKWWRGLRKRHPDFSLRTPEPTGAGRHMSMTRISISRYFGVLKSVLDDNDLYDKPQLIWNMDETGLSMAPRTPKVIAKKGSKVVHSKASNSRETITIIACGNAAGTVIPPHVILAGKTKRVMNGYDTENAPLGTKISVSDSGWTKQGISELWFVDTFLPTIGPDRPQILIMDGHDSHHHVEFIDRARKEGIVLVELPSKTSHFTQPFDRSVFKSFKSSWGEIVHEFTSATGVAVGHAQFFRMMKRAWEKSMTIANVRAGFEATGICPYNPGAIPDVAFAPSELYTHSHQMLASFTDTPPPVLMSGSVSTDTPPPSVLMPASTDPPSSALMPGSAPTDTSPSVLKPAFTDSSSSVLVPGSVSTDTPPSVVMPAFTDSPPSVLMPASTDSQLSVVMSALPPTESPQEVFTAKPLDMTHTCDVMTASNIIQMQNDTLDSSESSVIVNLDVFSGDNVVDLPVFLDEQGMIQLLDEQVGSLHTSGLSTSACATNDSSPTRNVESSTGTTNSASHPVCDAELALSVVESAISSEKKQLYISAFESGIGIENDSMYTTWSLYKSQILNSLPKNNTSINPMLVLPKQEFVKGKKKKSHYFVISSDDAFREKLQQKQEKEKKAALAAERKLLREQKKEQKMKALDAKKGKKLLM